jgi:hypothetical protein
LFKNNLINYVAIGLAQVYLIHINQRGKPQKERMKDTRINRIKMQIRIWLAVMDFRRAIRDAEKRKLKKEAGIFDLDAYRMGDGK